MSERMPEPNAADAHERRGMPRWVKVLLIVATLIVAILVVTQIAGVGGGHGPGRHGAAPAPMLTA